MHPLEKFTRKAAPSAPTPTSTSRDGEYFGDILSGEQAARAPLAPWMRPRGASMSTTTMEPEMADAPVAPPQPPPPSVDEIAAPYKAKIAELEKQLAAERNRMSDVVRKLADDLHQFESASRAIIVDMALVSARVFVGEVVPVDAIKNVVAKAIDNFPMVPSLSLHVASANAEALKDQVPAHLKIVVDPTLKPGDCRLESEIGGVDARLEVRAHELRQRLLATLLNGRDGAE